MTITIGLVVGLLLSSLIGLSLGLLGGGGSIITLPILVYVIGLDPREAVAVSLVVVGMTSVFGAWLHHERAGHVAWSSAAWFSTTGIVGALVGSRLTWMVSETTLLIIFASLMMVVAFLMLARKNSREDPAQPRERSTTKSLIAGFIVGVMTGFLGVGGGFLIVPALVLFAGLPTKEAIGTSLVVIAVNCAAGLVGHLSAGAIPWVLTGLVTGFAFLGATTGTRISLGTSPQSLRRGFAVFILLIGALILVQNFASWTLPADQ